MTRGRRRGTPRCNDCKAPVIFFRSPFTGGWRPFEAKPISPGQMHTAAAYPIENNVRAWLYRDLVEDLMVRRGIGQLEAEDEAHAMPWHAVHNCHATMPAEQEDE
jgi:hypothetical protein